MPYLTMASLRVVCCELVRTVDNWWCNSKHSFQPTNRKLVRGECVFTKVESVLANIDTILCPPLTFLPVWGFTMILILK